MPALPDFTRLTEQMEEFGTAAMDFARGFGPVAPAIEPGVADLAPASGDIEDTRERFRPKPAPEWRAQTNLCGGTGERLNPLAFDGWGDPCPGCDACADAPAPGNGGG